MPKQEAHQDPNSLFPNFPEIYKPFAINYQAAGYTYEHVERLKNHRLNLVKAWQETKFDICKKRLQKWSKQFDERLKHDIKLMGLSPTEQSKKLSREPEVHVIAFTDAMLKFNDCKHFVHMPQALRQAVNHINETSMHLNDFMEHYETSAYIRDAVLSSSTIRHDKSVLSKEPYRIIPPFLKGTYKSLDSTYKTDFKPIIKLLKTAEGIDSCSAFYERWQMQLYKETKGMGSVHTDAFFMTNQLAAATTFTRAVLKHYGIRYDEKHKHIDRLEKALEPHIDQYKRMMMRTPYKEERRKARIMCNLGNALKL